MRLAEHRVSFGHWAFLRILWETDGLTQRELSLQAGVMEPTTFAAIKAMEKLGYVQRRQKPSSRKNVYVFLTPAGRALKSKLVPFAEAVNEIAVRGIPAADVAVTRKTLLAMIENLAVADAASHGRNAPHAVDASHGTDRGRGVPWLQRKRLDESAGPATEPAVDCSLSAGEQASLAA